MSLKNIKFESVENLLIKLNAMKKYYSLLFIFAFSLSAYAQKVTGYSCKLDNGISVKTERTWSRVWVTQSQGAYAANEQPQSVSVTIRTMGELTKSNTTKLTSAGKDVKMKDAAPGTYDLRITSALAGKPGTIVTDISGVVVKPKMKTTVNVTFYDYQINIDETPAPGKGLASYNVVVNRYKGNTDQSFNQGVPTFFAKGSKENKITPDETSDKSTGKIKPGMYDLLITIEIPGYNQKVWLENFTMKADINYKISINMNAGEIVYGGIQRDVTRLHLYPLGTADKMQGAAKPDKTLEFLVCDPASSKFPCAPGSYDVLLNYGNGKKYEWKKSIVVRTGSATIVK